MSISGEGCELCGFEGCVRDPETSFFVPCPRCSFLETDEDREVKARLRISRGKAAFDAYNGSRGGKTWDGKPIPGWQYVGEGIREAWRLAAEAARGAM